MTSPPRIAWLLVLGASLSASVAAAADSTPDAAPPGADRAAAPAAEATPSSTPRWQRAVVVTGTRVHLGDLLLNADPITAMVDLGPAPTAGGSRLVTRADIAAAFEKQQLPPPGGAPDAVRVTRKVKHLAPADIDALVRTAMNAKELGHGVTLGAVRADHPLDVADGWTRVGIDVPRAPKKAGTFATTAIASLFAGDDVIARLTVPVNLSVSTEGAAFDVARGASLTLIVQRNLIEVRTPSFAAADADIGDAIVVQLRPSGRVMRARLVSKDEAIAVDGDR